MVTVDAELFETLAEAVAFVAELGGGIVFSNLAGTPFVKSMKIPEGVQVKLPSDRERNVLDTVD